MSDIFASMRDVLLSGPLAESVTINGVSERAFIHRELELIGDYGQVVGRQTQAEIDAGIAVQAGDSITIGAASYEFDTLISNDGTFARWVLRSA